MVGRIHLPDPPNPHSHSGSSSSPHRGSRDTPRRRVDLRFLNETKYFVSYHKSSRDWSNDTLWPLARKKGTRRAAQVA